jgi:multiple sugar transport system substrate-binding protein
MPMLDRRGMLVLTAGTAAGFAAPSIGRAQRPITLSLSSVNAYFTPVLEEVAAELRRAHPHIAISYRGTVEPWDDQLQRTILDATTGNKADIAFQGLNRVRIVAERRLAVPLDAFIAAEPHWADMGYSPALTSLGAHAGQIWGLPFRSSVPMLFYNPDLMRRGGSDAERFPESWAEIVAVAGRISALGDGSMGLYYDYAADGNWLLLALIHLQGAQMMSPDERTIAFDGPEGLRALQLLADIGRSGMIDMSRNQAQQSFVAGKVGIYASSSARLASLQQEVAGRFAVRAAPLPRMSAQARIPVGGGIATIAADDPTKQRAAWEYLKVLTGPVGQKIIVERTGLLPSNERAVPLLEGYYSAQPQARAALSQLPIVTGWYAFPGPNALRISSVIQDHMRSVITLQRPPEETLRAMRGDVAALLPQA